MTKQQQLIYHLIHESKEHPTADQIYWSAKKDIANISVGTVYRNLSQMAESGIVKRLTIPGQADRFDRSTIPHGHAICRSCGQLKDIFMDDLSDLIENTLGVDILSYELNVSYDCPECRALADQINTERMK